MTPAEIRQGRQTLGLTQTEMASALGVSLTGYQRWEADRSLPSHRGMPPLAERELKKMLADA